jgi:hypothetical protein
VSDTFQSTSDERVRNSTLRQQYRALTSAEKEQIDRIKELGQEFVDLLHEIGKSQRGSDRFASRDLALSNTHIEDAVMRAVRHITA